MRIVIDLQGAQNGSRHRGIGRYCAALAKAIVRNRGTHEVFILLNGLFPETIDEIRNSFSGMLPEHHFVVFSATGPVDELNVENSWRVRSAELLLEKFIDDLAPDIFLVSSLIEGACDNTVTSIGQLSSRVPTAAILYDLIPHLDPEKYIGWAPSRKWYYGKIDALKRADLLLAISHSARSEAIERLAVEEQRIVNISSAADPSFSNSNVTRVDVNKVRTRYGIKRKFLMHSSAFDERKNFEGLIKAFALVKKGTREKFQLVLVCKIDEAGRRRLEGLASDVGLEKSDLILTGYLPDDDLIVLYSECHLFVFPSFHEGFGLPVLEAMSCGAAVIGSNTSSIPEVVGRDDALFDPKSTNDIARLISRALTDEDFWRSLKEHALIQAKKYSWDQCAATTIREFEKLHAREDVVDGAGHGRVDFLENIASIKSEVRPSDNDLVGVAAAIVENEDSVCRLRAFADFGGKLKWRIEGPFDSSYSLALLNRETARAADAMGHFVVLHSTEGPGDFPANLHFLESNQDVASMHARVGDYPHESVDVVSRNLYPPRVEDMQGSLNLLHHYAWEESGFPHQWVNNFNANLNGITCLSNHVEKILIDNGVSVPMLTSGCGVDHWDRITPLAGYKVNARRFRFLHVSSCFPRKGVDLLLDAYGKAFTSDDDVSLVIKTFDNPHNEVYQWLAERKAQNVKFPDVQIIVNDINDSELKALYQECHVLVAPSKAEGFGLPMAEAMLSGLPVITTAWGGQLDFCNESNAWLVDYEFERAQTHFGLFASVWARVKVDELANVLTQAYNSPQAHLTEKALAGRRQLLKNFKWTDVVGRAVKAAQVWGCTQEHSTDVKIGWISTWNTKCGVATYSEHFLKNMDKANLTVLAPFADVDDSLKSDDVACIRCWNQGKEANNFDEIARCIREIAVNTVVVQFNYGFFNFSEFRDFLERQLDDGRVVIVIMHSTSDPFGVCENWQLSELQTAFARCQRILVHSVQDLNRLKAMGLVENVALFPHGVLDCQMAAPVAEKQLPTIASYGFCLPHKGLIELVQAIALLKEGGEFVRLKMVNAEYPDPVSSKLVNEIGALIKKLGVSDIIEMHTDFLADEESFSLLADANLLVFPYQQTGESASGAVRYGLAAKRPIVVSPLAIFDDIGGAAFRFSGTTAKDIAHGISTTLRELSENSVKAQGVEADAKQWREQHDYAVISKRLFNICQALVRKEFPRTSRFLGSSPRLSTVVGGIQGRSVVTTGVAGNLVHGPYLAMAAGKHQVTIRGAVGAGGLAEASVDVAVDQGRLVLGESVLGQVNDDCLASLVISLERAYDDLEVRVWVGESSELSISAVEIAPWLGEHEMGTVESKGMADRYRAFQDIAIDSKDADRRMKVGSPKSRLAEPEQRLMEIESSY